MGKTTIIEAQNSETVFENGSKGILGKLKGVFADYKHGTRNSDRLYSEELWDNRVFGSEDVMEALETKTLFGELDHPEGDRCETLAKNAAISITKLEKRPEEGVIYGEAEILDTPTGRIVKALADSGAKLGVSSRGMGEEIFVDGQNIIDPETYDFITFDVVVTPANTKARVELTESKKINKLTENLKKEIADSETENQLDQIRNVVENVNISNKDELLNLVENKLKSFKISEVSTKLSEANKSIAIKLLKQKYMESKAQLQESLELNNQLSDENEKLLEKVDILENSGNKLNNELKEARLKSFNNSNDTKELAKKYNNLVTENKNLKEQLKVTENKVNSLSSDLTNSKLEERNQQKEIMLKSRQISNRKLENTIKQYENSIASLNESIQQKDERIEKLIESNKNKQVRIASDMKIIKENKELKEKIKQLEESNKQYGKKLTEGKLQESRKIKELQSKIEELESNNQKMEEAQARFSKLSFDPVGTVKAVAENFSTGDYDQDDMDLFRALTGNK